MSGGNLRDLTPSDIDGEASLEDVLPRRKLVVVIGIDDYASLPRLRCAVSDAVGVQDLLVRQFGFEAPIPPLTNGAATRPAIEALVDDQLRKILEPDDALIFFFAGHGTTRVTRLKDLTVETGYLAPVEARAPDQYSDLINMEELLRRAALLPARHILAVLDACHSGMALGSGVSRYRSMGSYLHQLASNLSRRVITSARRDEPALDDGPVPGHSLFTGTLIHALTSGEADLDGNGVITFSELALLLQQRVAQASGSRQTPDYGAFHLDDRGELVIALQRAPEAKPGTLVADRYRVVRKLRSETGGDVLAAADVRTGANVSMKLLRPDDLASSPVRRARLSREAEALTSIYSRHVPRVLDVAEDRWRGPVIVLEPSQGELLIDRLRREGPLPFEKLHPLLDQVWVGLTDIHRVGVVHRALKPSSLLLEQGLDGVTRVKILDFAICKLPRPDDPIARGEVGRVLGVFSYMPPEQIVNSSAVDHRADIYACASLIYQACSGHLPYAARDLMQMVDQKLKADARRLREVMGHGVHAGLEAFVARALDRRPERRFQTSEEALVAWRALLPAARPA